MGFKDDLGDSDYHKRRSTYLRRDSIVTHDVLRRGSQAAIHAIRAVEQGAEIGNPLDLKVNEIRKVSIVDLPRTNDFDGRLSSHNSTRRPSTFVSRESLSSKYTLDDPSEYAIQRLAAHDDIELMSKTSRLAYKTAPIWAVLSLMLYWTYFALRVRFTLSAQDAAHKIFGMAWAFIGVEIGVAIPMVLHRTWSLLVVRGRKRPKLRLIGNEVPSVDCIITCCGEEDEVVFDTAKAACNVDYPSDRFRVIILDDGNSAGLRAMVEERRLHKFDNMHYRSRPKYPGVPHHFKAGNLNYGLGETKLMKGGAANFFAALDADMIPERDWLRALLPHMLQDSKCSMACPPQVRPFIDDDLLSSDIATAFLQRTAR